MDRPGYLSTVRLPGIGVVLTGGMFGRLAYGIIPFASVVAFSIAHGFTAAGAATAAFMTANALLGPIRGRLVDRHGPRALAFMTGAHLLAIAATAILLPTKPWIIAVALLALAGATLPPIGPALRTSWSRLAKDKDALQQVHALDSVAEEITFVVAPLLTIALAAATSARWAILIGATLLIPSVAVISRFGRLEPKPATPGSTDKADAGTAHAARRPLMLRATGQGIVIPIITLGAVGGGLTVLFPALAEDAGNITASGYAFAAYSLGGAITGLIYGRLRWNAPLSRKYAVITTAFTFGVATLIAATNIPLTMLAALLAGAALSPMFIVAYLLVDERIEQDRLTEANSWLGSGYNIGNAGGAALCGLLITHTTTTTTVAVLYTAIAAVGAIGSLRLPRKEPSDTVPGATAANATSP